VDTEKGPGALGSDHTEKRTRTCNASVGPRKTHPGQIVLVPPKKSGVTYKKLTAIEDDDNFQKTADKSCSKDRTQEKKLRQVPVAQGDGLKLLMGRDLKEEKRRNRSSLFHFLEKDEMRRLLTLHRVPAS